MNNVPPVIRRFSPKDLDQILNIEANAFPKSAYPPETFFYYYRNYPDTFLVFEAAGVLGYIIFEPQGHIISLAVDPQHRRKGIGTQLVGECESRIHADGLLVEVRKGNMGAQMFYSKMGFQQISEILGYYGAEDACVMTKKRIKKGFK